MVIIEKMSSSQLLENFKKKIQYFLGGRFSITPRKILRGVRIVERTLREKLEIRERFPRYGTESKGNKVDFGPDRKG